MPRRILPQEVQGVTSVTPAASPVNGFAQPRIARPSLKALADVTGAGRQVAGALTANALKRRNQREQEALALLPGAVEGSDLGETLEQQQERLRGLPEAASPKVQQTYWELQGQRAFRELVQGPLTQALNDRSLSSDVGPDGQQLPDAPPIEQRINEIIAQARQSAGLLGNPLAASTFDGLSANFSQDIENQAQAQWARVQTQQGYDAIVQNVTDSVLLMAGQSDLLADGETPAIITASDFEPASAFIEGARLNDWRQAPRAYVTGVTEAIKTIARQEGPDSLEKALEMLDAFGDVEINGLAMKRNTLDLSQGETIASHLAALEDELIRQHAGREERALREADRAAASNVLRMQQSVGEQRRDMADADGPEAAYEWAKANAQQVGDDYGHQAREEFLNDARAEAIAFREDRKSSGTGHVDTLISRILDGEDVLTDAKALRDSKQITPREYGIVKTEYLQHTSRQPFKEGLASYKDLRDFADNILPRQIEDREILIEENRDAINLAFDAELSEVLKETQDHREVRARMSRWVAQNRKELTADVRARAEEHETARNEYLTAYQETKSRLVDQRAQIHSAFNAKLIDDDEYRRQLAENTDGIQRKNFYGSRSFDPLKEAVKYVTDILTESPDFEEYFRLQDAADSQAALVEAQDAVAQELLSKVQSYLSSPAFSDVPESAQYAAVQSFINAAKKEVTASYQSDLDKLAQKAAAEAGLEGAPAGERISFKSKLRPRLEDLETTERSLETQEFRDLDLSSPFLKPFLHEAVEDRVYDRWTSMVRAQAGNAPLLGRVTPLAADFTLRREIGRLAGVEGLTDKQRTESTKALVLMRGMSADELLSNSVSIGLTKREAALVPRSTFLEYMQPGTTFTDFKPEDVSLARTPIRDWADLSDAKRLQLLRLVNIPESELERVSSIQTQLNALIQ